MTMPDEPATGPELDAEVAKAMGLVPCADWEPINFGSGGGPAVRKRCGHAAGACYSTVVYGGGGCPRYSTEIAAAWAVVERMLDHPDQEVYLRFYRFWGDEGFVAPGYLAALRICRAALRALGREKDSDAD